MLGVYSNRPGLYPICMAFMDYDYMMVVMCVSVRHFLLAAAIAVQNSLELCTRTYKMPLRPVRIWIQRAANDYGNEWKHDAIHVQMDVKRLQRTSQCEQNNYWINKDEQQQRCRRRRFGRWGSAEWKQKKPTESRTCLDPKAMHYL